MSDCIFCRIVSGELPSEELTSTTRVVAFRDVAPAAPSHVLVVSREHIASVDSLEPTHGELLAEMISTAQEVARAEGVAQSGYRLVFNVGDDAQLSVPHLHLHVLGGRSMSWPPG